MPDEIQEGPFQNFTGIHFPVGGYRLAGWKYNLAGDPMVYGQVSYADFSGDVANLGRYLRGKESGFYIDTLNIPEWPSDRQPSGVLDISGATINPYYRGPYYNHLTGDLYDFDDRPFIGVLKKRSALNSSSTFPQSAVTEWHYCPKYNLRYTDLTWNEGGADTKTVIVNLNVLNGGAGAPANEVYQRTYDKTVTTLEATIQALTSDVNASSYVSATYPGGTTMRVENTDPAEPFWFSHTMTPVFSGMTTAQSFTGIIVDAAPAYGFEFNGIQNLSIFDSVDFDQAEEIHLVDELPVEE